MFRASLRVVLLIGVVAAPAWAGSQSGTYSAASRHYGKTIVSVPGTFYSVKVDSAGKVFPVSGSEITVLHEDTGAPCHSVTSVGAAFQTTVSVASPKPSRSYPAACSFPIGSATFKVTYPIYAEKAAEDLVLRRACEQRPAGTTVVAVPLPSFTGFKVTLEYAGGGFDELVYPQPKVTVTCETLALESATVTPTTFGPGGGSAKIDAKISSPVASITAVRAKITVSSKVSPLALTLSSGTAKSGVWSGTYAVPANPNNSTLKYVVTFEATDDKGAVTTLTPAPQLTFVSSTLKAPVLPTSTAVPAPTLRH
jgi:hypothetical protein